VRREDAAHRIAFLQRSHLLTLTTQRGDRPDNNFTGAFLNALHESGILILSARLSAARVYRYQGSLQNLSFTTFGFAALIR